MNTDLIEMKDYFTISVKLERLTREHFQWSDEAFGTVKEHSTIGTLKHLAKEIDEIMEDPSDIEEWADGYLLLMDGARRAGHSVEQILDAAYAKLQVNKQRIWAKPSSPDESIEHVRSVCKACEVGMHDHCGRQVSASGVECNCTTCWPIVPKPKQLSHEEYVESRGGRCRHGNLFYDCACYEN